jgi:CBS domain-containing protein
VGHHTAATSEVGVKKEAEMLVGDVMHEGTHVISPRDSFAQAAEALRERRISSLVVSDDGTPAGIVTERDVVGVVADGMDPAITRIGERMTGGPVTVERDTDLREVARIMALRGIRHLPVVDGGMLVGMVSMRDLVSWACTQIEVTPDLWPDLMAAIATEWPH